MDGYSLSRNWFDFSFENPEKMSPEHTAIYLLAVEMWNRLGQKEKFGFPACSNMEALGIKNHRTYKKYFDDLVEWGFLKIIQESKNQYTANVIALVKNTQANTKALDKANARHCISTAYIDKQLNNKTIKQINIEEVEKISLSPLEEKIEEFIIFRKTETKVPLGPIGKTALIKKLSQYPDNIAIQMINESIENGWKGVFELKKQFGGRSKPLEEYQKPGARDNFEFFTPEQEAKYGGVVSA